jgi:hypothetical protein
MVLILQIVRWIEPRRDLEVIFLISSRPVQGRIGNQGDLCPHASVLHGAVQKRFGGVHVPVPAEKVRPFGPQIDGAVHNPYTVPEPYSPSSGASSNDPPSPELS